MHISCLISDKCSKAIKDAATDVLHKVISTQSPARFVNILFSLSCTCV